jgi:antitoxin component YwqK of YwqJK toxin-antitoxin module
MLRILFLFSLLTLSLEAHSQETPIDMKELILEKEGPFFVFYLQGNPYSGSAVKYNGDGIKVYEGIFKNGRDHGPATRWYDNGSKKSQTSLKEGKLHGTIIEWYENGNKKFEASFEEGIQNGTRTKWYENGNKYREENYILGRKTYEKEWDESGTLTKNLEF